MHGGYVNIMKYKEGVVFAGLKVKKHMGKKILCVCTNCNNEVTIALSSITRKVAADRKFCQNCRIRRTDDNYIYESAMYDFKKKAEERKLSWNLTFDQFVNIITKECHYCSSPPFSNRFKRKEWNSSVKINGVDRKNNNIGYELKNCVPCCGICNRAKSSMSYKDFIDYIERIRGSK